MATLNTRSQTHRRVLPQPAALESVGADTPEGGHETAHGHRLSGGTWCSTWARGDRADRHPVCSASPRGRFGVRGSEP